MTGGVCGGVYVLGWQKPFSEPTPNEGHFFNEIRIKDPTFTKIGKCYSICTYANETEAELRF